MDNKYSGYSPTHSEPVDTISLADASHHSFFVRYVAARRPCVIEGLLDAPFASWTIADLRKRVGDSIVEVEHREVRNRYHAFRYLISTFTELGSQVWSRSPEEDALWPLPGAD